MGDGLGSPVARELWPRMAAHQLRLFGATSPLAIRLPARAVLHRLLRVDRQFPTKADARDLRFLGSFAGRGLGRLPRYGQGSPWPERGTVHSPAKSLAADVGRTDPRTCLVSPRVVRP